MPTRIARRSDTADAPFWGFAEAATGGLSCDDVVLLIDANIVGALASLVAFAVRAELVPSCGDSAVTD